MEKAINEGWTFVDERKKIEDLESYIFKQLSDKPGTEIYIGTDGLIASESRTVKKLRFITVILFRTVGIPCVNHVILRRHNIFKEGKKRLSGSFEVPTAVKLNMEIELTSKLALWFRDTVKIDPEVHLDLNPNENAGSFEVYSYIKGYFESLGFKCEYKPAGQAIAASAIADYFL